MSGTKGLAIGERDLDPNDCIPIKMLKKAIEFGEQSGESRLTLREIAAQIKHRNGL